MSHARAREDSLLFLPHEHEPTSGAEATFQAFQASGAQRRAISGPQVLSATSSHFVDGRILRHIGFVTLAQHKFNVILGDRRLGLIVPRQRAFRYPVPFCTRH